MVILHTFVVEATIPTGWTLEAETPFRVRPLAGNPDYLAQLTGGTLTIRDAGMAPPPTRSYQRTVPPKVLRAELHLQRSDGSHVETVYVNRSMALALRPGDVLAIARNSCAGNGVSVLRDNDLMIACAAVISVPLGKDVAARGAGEQMQRAEAVFKQVDPTFTLAEIPIAISAGGQTRLIYQGRSEVGGYLVWADHGFLRGIPGQSECLAIWRPDFVPDPVAISSAMLAEETHRRG